MTVSTNHLVRSAGASLMLLLASAGGDASGVEGGDAALSSPLAAQREQALDQLIASHDTTPQHLSRLAVLLDDEDLYVAGKAVTALSLYGADAFAAISDLLAHGSVQQRWGATIALYRTSADIEGFVPALTRELADADERLVRASVSALGRLGSGAAPALPALTALLTHEQFEIRWAALATLAAIGPQARAALPQIMPLLGDGAPELRVAAAAAVARIQPPAPIPAQQLADDLAWLQERVPALMAEHHVPGVSIAIIQHGEIYWTRGFGVRDVRNATPVTIDTIFEACSMSKPIMALGVLQLIQQRRLDLDRPLTRYLGRDYLPDQPEQRLITARMALTHRTGLPNWRIGYDEMGGPLPILFPPGSDYRYSGEGMLFLQRAVEAITGTSLDEYALHELFAPLHLAHTSFVWTQEIDKNLASGHDEHGRFKQRTHYRKANGAYSLYTTPSDYARLMLTLMKPNVLDERGFSQASIDLMLQRQQRVLDDAGWERPGLAHAVATYRALAWSIDVTAAGDIVQHSGSNSSGFRTFGQFNRARRSGLVIFTNADGGAALRDEVVERIGDL